MKYIKLHPVDPMFKVVYSIQYTYKPISIEVKIQDTVTIVKASMPLFKLYFCESSGCSALLKYDFYI